MNQVIKFWFVFLLLGVNLLAQVSGDYRSKQTGNWDLASNWETYDGAGWSTATVKPGATNNVYVQYSHIMTLTMNESCADLHLAIMDGGTGVLAAIVKIQTNTLSVNGKLRAYTAAVNTIPGANAGGSLSFGSTKWPIQSSTGGLLKIVGGSRALTTSGEWGAGANTSGSYTPDVEVALNTGATVTLGTNIKFGSWNFTSGTFDAAGNNISADVGTSPLKNITVGVNGTLANPSSLQRTSGGLINTFTMNGTLLYSTYATPKIQATTIAFNGTVKYDASIAQTLVVAGSGGASPGTYTNLVFSNSGNKTLGLNTTVNGTLSFQGSGTFSLGSTTTFTLTYGSSSVLEYSGSAAQTTGAEWTSTAATVNINNAAGVTLGMNTTMNGALKLSTGAFSAGSFTLTYGSSSSLIYNQGGTITASIEWGAGTSGIFVPASVTIQNNTVLTMPAEDRYCTGAMTITSGELILNEDNGNLYVGGNWSRTGTFTPNGRSVIFNGTGSQSLTGTTTFDNLTVSNSTSGLTLNNDITVNQVLALAGKISTGSNSVIIPSGASVNRTSGQIAGRLQMYIPTGTNTKTFHVGDQSSYTPVDITFHSVTTAGNVTVYITGGTLHPNLSSSDINSNLSVNRYWTISNSGVVFTDYNLTLNFLASQILNFADPYSFIGGRYNSGWTYPGIETNGDTYITMTGINGFGDFAVGEQVPQTPIVTISGTLNNFGTVAINSVSAEQTFSVSGQNLTAALTVTAPSGFQVSQTTGTGFTSTINLTPNHGIINSTTIYARFAPTSAGTISGNITASSSGATTQNLGVGGTAIYSEPTSASTNISFSSVLTSQLTLGWTSGNGAYRIVVGRQAAAVNFTPADGQTYSANSNFSASPDLGSGNKILYASNGNSVTVSGLSSGTPYYFTVYEFNGSGGYENYLTSSSLSGSITSVSYIWTGATSTDWQVSTNWSPERTSPATGDVLKVNSGGTVTVTNMPTQTIGQFLISDNTTLNLQSAATATLTISGNQGVDLLIPSGSAFNFNGTFACTMMLATGTTGSISGTVTYSNAAHILNAADPSAVTFNSGSIFTQASGCTGNVFTTSGSLNVIVFANGSTFISQAGSNPFGASAPSSKLVFQTGSLYRHEHSGTPSFSNRTYGNFELNYNGTISYTSGSNLCKIDNLTITKGRLRFTVGNLQINNNIYIAAGAGLRLNQTTGVTLNSDPNAFTFVVDGTIEIGTTITNFKTPTFGSQSTLGYSHATSAQTMTTTEYPLTNGPRNLILDNSVGVTVDQARTLPGVLTLGGNAVYNNLSNITGYTGLVYAATAGQTAGSEFGSTISYLRCDNTAGLTLNESKTVSDSLVLTSNGKIILGSNDLTLGTGAYLADSSGSFVVVNGSGSFIKNFSSTGSFNFPIGTSTDAKATKPRLTISSGTFGSGACVKARVTAAKHPSNTSSTDYVNRYWTLSSAGITGLSANLTFAFYTADAMGTRTNYFTGNYGGSSWTGYDRINPANDTVLIANNISSFGEFTGGEADAMNAPDTIMASFIPYGVYNTSAGTLNNTDTYTVKLASASSPYSTSESTSMTLNASSFTGTARFQNIASGNYYLVVSGRNALETWSALPVTVTRGGKISYDFTTAASQAYGSNLIQKGTKWCIYSGDVNQDGLIDFSDLKEVDNDSYNNVTGVTATDIDGSGAVDYTDVRLCDENVLSYVQAKKPAAAKQEPGSIKNREGQKNKSID